MARAARGLGVQIAGDAGASPLLIERFRKGYPQRIFDAVTEVGTRTTRGLRAVR